MANTNLAKAKTARNDEFYTQYADIQKEINAYLEYDPDVFRGKTILLPCDDRSNSGRYSNVTITQTVHAHFFLPCPNVIPQTQC